ncbi:GNAT family N-acetyltransferase [Flavilitoribacter nigricans]|uniref:GNAT family N-acetyltransferase n=1 Tax=Flavilitoribacter nigricans (strain ATCC 23147 / DSM 23189 / NBRC 102662 / NCIMB 1420 / SS-2) TaxID=1122177 RepID=A0A2D0N1S9_FLAN2|nr:GNAT family N-acetyltransferase [Flavilitoribacter nigricans]PHN02491.1 GNAT family N-acetyltransferase [Flavilitoribacter nigricans DSM 23189 = NBRC 102662]
MEKDILYREGNFHIRRYSGIPEDALTFLDRIAWGNEGAVYEHKNTEEHIRQLHRPSLIAIYEGEEIRGTAAFCNTPVGANGREFNCFYIRYFASSPAIRGKGVMKNFSIKVMELIREREAAKTVYFACIERDNRGSYRVVESAGYTNIGTIKTMGFSRFFPRLSPRVDTLGSVAERETVLNLLRKHYRGHALVQFNALFLNDDYYVIREGDEIVAGCQYHRVHWVVNRMKGMMGKVIMNVVPLVPLLNQLFNPRRFEFLAFEGIYCKPGYEDRLQELFESLLAQEGLKSSMFWMGETCPHRIAIERYGNPGLIHTFIKDSDVYILAAFQNMDESEIQLVKDSPLYASAFDYI